MNSTNQKPLLLPPEIVQMVRGERGYTEDSKDLAELARYYYQDGRAGRTYDFTPPPPAGIFPPHIVEWGEDFLRACWELGRWDTGRARA